MGEYADIRSKKFIRFLNWLSKNKDIEIQKGSRHNYKVSCIHNGSVDEYAFVTKFSDFEVIFYKIFEAYLLK